MCLFNSNASQMLHTNKISQMLWLKKSSPNWLSLFRCVSCHYLLHKKCYDKFIKVVAERSRCCEAISTVYFSNFQIVDGISL